MSDSWLPICILANVDMVDGIEHEFAMLVGSKHSHVQSLRDCHPAFDRFVASFSDCFGQPFEPAVLLVHAEHQNSIRHIDKVSSFRDLIAVAAITSGRSRALATDNASVVDVMFGETFAFYPWMIDRKFEGLVCNSPALLAAQSLDDFKGSSSPELRRVRCLRSSFDRPLLGKLLERWGYTLHNDHPDWRDVALFRSLNMAYNAAMMPANSYTRDYDVGRLIALWISAFEILVHPGLDGRATAKLVIDRLIEEAPYLLDASKEKEHDLSSMKIKNVSGRKTLASWIYASLYKCRNDFLHGNPVDTTTLDLPNGKGGTWYMYAASVYRLALEAFLLNNSSAVRESDSSTTLDEELFLKWEEEDQMKITERAILTVQS